MSDMSDKEGLTRRDFLRTVAGGIGGAVATSIASRIPEISAGCSFLNSKNLSRVKATTSSLEERTSPMSRAMNH